MWELPECVCFPFSVLTGKWLCTGRCQESEDQTGGSRVSLNKWMTASLRTLVSLTCHSSLFSPWWHFIGIWQITTVHDKLYLTLSKNHLAICMHSYSLTFFFSNYDLIPNTDVNSNRWNKAVPWRRLQLENHTLPSMLISLSSFSHPALVLSSTVLQAYSLCFVLKNSSKIQYLRKIRTSPPKEKSQKQVHFDWSMLKGHRSQLQELPVAKAGTA